METIIIHSLLSKSNAISHSDGVKVYTKLRKYSEFDLLSISFKDIERASTGFLNASIGRFLLKNPEVLDKIKFVDTSEMINKKIAAVVETTRINEKYDDLIENAIC